MTINPELFSLLQRRFGDDGVKVIREDVLMSSRYTNRQVLMESTGDYARRTNLDILPNGQGEEYLVNCPYCGDTRQRLTINHRWGVFDSETSTRNLWLAQCFNESQCLSEYSAQRDLYDQVYSVNIVNTDQLAVAGKKTVAAAANGRVRLPSGLWPIDDMAERTPNHPALSYLLDRLIDPVYIGKEYHATYCIDTPNPVIRGRLVVPIIRNGRLVSWQARLLRDQINKKEVKWYTAPRTAVSTTLYNIDDAFEQKTVVVVEGISDVWGFGRQACGVFKKSISATQANLLVEGVRADATVVILFDPNQHEKEIAKGNPHHIEVARQQLEGTSLKGRVLPVYLPLGRDPGDLDRAYMRDLITTEGRRNGINVDFNRK